MLGWMIKPTSTVSVQKLIDDRDDARYGVNDDCILYNYRYDDGRGVWR